MRSFKPGILYVGAWLAAFALLFFWGPEVTIQIGAMRFSTVPGIVKVSASGVGSLFTEKQFRWMQFNGPATGSTASTSRAAVSGSRHVADCISYGADSAVAPALTLSSVALRDGATGAGTALYAMPVAFGAATGNHFQPVNLCGLNVIGSNNTAMTLEFTGGAANVNETVTLSGFTVTP